MLQFKDNSNLFNIVVQGLFVSVPWSALSLSHQGTGQLKRDLAYYFTIPCCDHRRNRLEISAGYIALRLPK